MIGWISPTNQSKHHRPLTVPRKRRRSNGYQPIMC
jgi:hypothetical protein